MVWISKKFLKDDFNHTKWKINFKKSTFGLLGVQFSVKFEDVVELN